MEHVSDLELSIDDSRFSEGDQTFIRDVIQAMKFIGENGRNLKDLTISFPFFPCWINPEFSQLLQDAFSDMFKGLKKFNSLKLVELNLESYKNFSPDLDIFSQDFGLMVTHLIVKNKQNACFDNLSVLNQQFSKLEYLYIESATVNAWNNIRSPKLWSSQVENTFQDFAMVEIYLQPTSSKHSFHLRKLPYQKSVIEVDLNLEILSNSSHHLDVFSQDFGAMVTHLNVDTMPNARGDNLMIISHRFPKLQYLSIKDASVGRECGEDWDWHEVGSLKLWSSTVDETFQDFTQVEIYLKPAANGYCYHLLKEPFQKSVFQNTRAHTTSSP